MPRHRRGIEHITLFGVEFAGVLELTSDMADLHDPPFRRSGVHVTKDRVRIESTRRFRATTATATSSATAAATSTRTAVAAFIERIIGIGKPIERVREQMVLIHLRPSLFT